MKVKIEVVLLIQAFLKPEGFEFSKFSQNGGFKFFLYKRRGW